MCAHIPAPTQASETDLDPLSLLHAKSKIFQQNQLLHNFLSQKQSMQQNQYMRTRKSTPEQPRTNLQYRDWFCLRKHPCFCSLSRSDLQEQLRYRTANRKNPKTKPPTKPPHTTEQERVRRRNELSLCTFSFFRASSALSSLLF